MSGVNKAILLGRLGKDPELRYTQNGKSMCTFSLATSERWGDEEKVEWHKIVMFDRVAEIANQYLRKGDQVYLEGKIQTRSWNDKAGGKHNVTEILAAFMQMLGSPKGQKPLSSDYPVQADPDGAPSPEDPPSAQAPKSPPTPGPKPQAGKPAPDEDPLPTDDDMPF
jgi:single-strand DNA-binding protein